MSSIPIEKLRDLFVRPGHVGQADFADAVKESERSKVTVERVLVERGLVTDENLGRTIADGFDIHFVDLTKVKPADELLEMIPEVAARAQQAVIFERSNGVFKVATTNPDNYEFFRLLERNTGLKVELYYASPLGLEEALNGYRGDLGGQARDLIDDLKNNPENEQNIVKLVNLFLEYAHDNRASDIHIEPLESRVSVRYRIDGVLHEVAAYPKGLHEKIVFRIKIMSRLRTDEHEAAQDGRFDYHKDRDRFDVRVSTVPVTTGENVVLRLLTERARRLPLEEIGLVGADLDKVKRAADKPFGMLLVVGPTGSGKTTTLYALLQILNTPEVNIMTIEDPVEYQIEHVQQIQVNPKKGMTSATGLRSIVRQDPDIIMVGEIRDNDTADIAVNAAMTGHLLLSTMHANDAATAFPRFTEMGVESFLVASSVNVVVAQRLVRKICEKCRYSRHLDDQEISLLKSEPLLGSMVEKVGGKKNLSKLNFYQGKGCKVCGQTGYAGRTGIFEVMEMAEDLRPLIVARASSHEIEQKAKALGMRSMLHDGMAKALQGITTLEEVIKATKT